jgi:hypothetical protein
VVLCWAYLREVVFENNQVTMKHDPFDAIEESIHVDFASILHSLIYSVGPSSVVRSKLGPAPPFPPMRVLEVSWSLALDLVWEVALSLHSSVKKRKKGKKERERDNCTYCGEHSNTMVVLYVLGYEEMSFLMLGFQSSLGQACRVQIPPIKSKC